MTASAQVVAPGGGEAMAEMVRGMHDRIAVHAAPTEAAEAEFVVATIERLIGGHTFLSIDSGRAGGGRRRDLAFGDFAVLYRTEAQSAALCEALARAGMPVKTSSHLPIADQPAVRALLQALDGTDGESPLQGAVGAAAARLSAAGALDVAAAAQASRWLSALAESAGDRAGLRAAAALATEADFFDSRADRVSLTTMHAAKGLEFAVVFIVGVEDGIMPLHWGGPDPATTAEERRLFYVAMTRAKDRLYLSRAVQRHWRGRLRRLAPSPFLADIEAQLLHDHPVDLPPRRPASLQLTLF